MKFFLLFLSLNIFANKPPFKDVTPQNSIDPTTFYLIDEEKFSCKGKYGGQVYDGSEKENILDPNGKTIATVCGRYFAGLSMEGSGILKDRGNGRITVNYYSKGRFMILEHCMYGLGNSGKCLIPFFTLAADASGSYKYGDVLYIPKAKGIKLPDGSTHNGMFVILDTGCAFWGQGPKRIDMFIGTQTDEHNIFIDAGITHPGTYDAFRVDGKEKAQFMEFLEKKHPDLQYDYGPQNAPHC